MEARTYIGWETPCRPWGGDRPLSLGGGPTRPPPSTHPRPGTSLQIQKKNYIKILLLVAGAAGLLSPLGRATGGYFRNFSKQTYIFEIFIFLNIKKKKTRRRVSIGPAQTWPDPTNV